MNNLAKIIQSIHQMQEAGVLNDYAYQQTIIPQSDAQLLAHFSLALFDKEHRKCKWSEDAEDYFWVSSCGLQWQFMDDGPKENDMTYCPKCGGRLIVNNTPLADI